MAPRPITVIAILALALAACADDAVVPTTSATTSAPSTTGATTTTTDDGAAPGTPATLITVFDGDTVLVSMEGDETEIRLLGINSPEEDECFYREARTAITTFLDAGPLTVEVTEEDQFGRSLGYLYAGGTLANLALVQDGYALALQTDHPRLAEFLAAEDQAYGAGRGLWAPDACGPALSAAVGLVEMSADPAGPDEDDLNGEWVFFANDDDEVIDFTGWVLRDESSQNRYHFPDGFEFHPGEGLAIHSGCGQDGPVVLYWCADSPVWNNGGDTVLLLDPSGNVALRMRY